MILAMMLAGADVQSAFTSKMVSGWFVSPDEYGCSALTNYEDDAVLFLSADVGKATIWMSLGDPKFKSIKAGEKYPVKVVFRKPNGKYDDAWGTINFIGGQVEGGNQTLTMKFKPELLDDIASSTMILFLKDDNAPVDTLSLDGSREMAAALKECARIREKENPSDPFG